MIPERTKINQFTLIQFGDDSLQTKIWQSFVGLVIY